MDQGLFLTVTNYQQIEGVKFMSWKFKDKIRHKELWDEVQRITAKLSENEILEEIQRIIDELPNGDIKQWAIKTKDEILISNFNKTISLRKALIRFYFSIIVIKRMWYEKDNEGDNETRSDMVCV